MPVATSLSPQTFTGLIGVALKRCLIGVSMAIVAAAGAGTLSGFAARHGWHLELASHFRVQYFWALAGAGGALALLRWKKSALVAAALAVANLALIVPLYFGPPPHAGLGPPLRAMSFNVHYLNHRYGATLELILTELPDFVLLEEVTPEWVEALKFLKPDYPYQHEMPFENGGGLALYSRHPILDFDVHTLDEYGMPTIVANVEVPGGRLTLLGTHTPSPRSAVDFEDRNRQLEQVAQLARAQSGPVLVLGDLNCTSWSPYFQQLLADSGLRDSRLGFGVEGSWPWFSAAVLRVPIDHCLVSPSVTVLDRWIGPAVGSDHRPLLVEFALAES